MATENNKNIKYDSKQKVLSLTKKLKTETTINTIKGVVASFINAVKEKHL